MISWIKGKVIDFWQINQKFFVLINCNGLGYEIQVLESLFIELNKINSPDFDITLWLKHIKKEDSDLLFGFSSKDQKDFFVEIISIRGFGSQIGIGLLNKLSTIEVINAIKTENKKLISSVPGIGKKMTDRIILELKSKFKNELQIDEESNKDQFLIESNEINKMIGDIQLTLQSLNYPKKKINNILPMLIKDSDLPTKNGKNISFENLLKLAMNYLDNDSSNIVR